MADIDQLSIGIYASSRNAETAIDRLIIRLGALDDALGRLNGGHFTAEMDGVADKLQGIANVATGLDAQPIKDMASGINSLARAGEKLTAVGDAASPIQNVANGLSSLQGIDLTSLNGIDFTGLAAAVNSFGGDKATNASYVLPQLAAGLRAFEGLTLPQGDFAGFAAGLRTLGSVKIGNASMVLPVIADGLKQLAAAAVNLPNQQSAASLAAFTTALSKLGHKNVSKAVSNIPLLAKAFQNLVIQLSNLPQVSRNTIDLANALGNLASQGGKVGTATRAMVPSLHSFSFGAKAARTHTLSLAAAIGKLYASFWVIMRVARLLGKAIDLSSDLTEVQNVVNTVYGNMSHVVEDFAKTSRDTFGISELTAKEIASRYQAMAKAMGISNRQAGAATDYLTGKLADTQRAYKDLGRTSAEMSVNLTKLAADMASFYNRSPEEVAESLNAIFTGQTRPLRQYGLDLTQATLKEWAMKEGLDADIQSMSQAEKTMLRYQYVMAQSRHVMGDFAKTADTWHNTVLRMKEAFKALGVVLGSGLIQLLKPAIQRITAMLNSLISVVQTVINALGKIFGWQVDIEQVGVALDDSVGGVSDGLDDAAGGAADTAKGMDKAAKAAKEMNHQLAAYDELNNFTLPKDNNSDEDGSGSPAGGGSGAGGAGGGGGGGATGGGVRITKKDYDSWLDNLWELGRYLSDELAFMLEHIDWDRIYEKARRFGKGLADFLNGLITPRLFRGLGHTIAGALNTVLHALDSFGHQFDWKKFGQSLAAGLNEFFRTFDFALLADTINVWVKGILDTIIKFIQDTDWNLVGQKIGEFLADLDFAGIGKKVGKAIWEAINAGFDMWEGMFSAAPLETAIITAVGGVAGILAGKGALSKILSKIGAGAAGAAGAEGASQLGFLSSAVAIISKNKDKILGAAAGVAEFLVTSHAVGDITKELNSQNTEWRNIALSIAEVGASFAIAGSLLSAAFGPAGWAVSGVIAATAAIVGYKNEIQKELDISTLQSVGTALSEPGGIPIEDLANHYSEAFTEVEKGFKATADASEGLLTARDHLDETNEKIDLLKQGMDNGALATGSKVAEISAYFQQLYDETSAIMQQEYDVIMFGLSDSFDAALQTQGTASSAVLATVNALNTEITGKMDEQKKALAELDAQYAAGKIEMEDYVKNAIPIFEEMQKLSGKTSEYEEQVNSLSNAIGSVNFSQIVTETDGIDMTALTAQVNQVAASFQDAKNSVTDAAAGMGASIDDYLAKAQNVGNEEAVGVLSKAAIANAESAKEATEQLTQQLTEYADTIQKGLVEELPAVIEQAQADFEDYKKKHPFDFLTTEESFVEEAVGNYKTDVIDVFAENLQQQYSDLGVEAAPWVTDAFNEILKSGYENVDFSYEGDMGETMTQSMRQMVDDMGGAIQDAITEYDFPKTFEAVGEDMATGTGTGVTNNTKEVTDAVGEMSEEALDSARTTLDSHSPSRKFMEIGADSVAGYNLGIQKKAPESLKVIQAWVKGVSTELTKAFETLFTTTLPPYFNAEKWQVLFDTLQELMSTQFETYVAWFEEAMSGFWDGKFVPWFEKSKWQAEFKHVEDAAEESFSNVQEIIEEAFNNAVQAAEEAIDGMIHSLNNAIDKIDEVIQKQKEMNDAVTEGAGRATPKYASGGFPEDGLFYANHTELVGRFSNGRTAVANNDQIVAGIQAGVYNAVVSAMADSGGNQVTIVPDPNGIFKVVQTQARQYNRRTGSPAFG